LREARGEGFYFETIVPTADGATPMIIAKLLTKKRQLVDRLHEVDLGDGERAEHEAVLAKIDTALDLLEPAIARQIKQDDVRTASRRERDPDGREPRASPRRAPSDAQDALALVRWRQKVRRNG
jgi:hypothetical protein